MRTAKGMFPALLFFACNLAWGADYPTRPITIVVPFAPGATTDAAARFVAKGGSELTGQAWIVTNRTGGSGAIGSEIVAKSAPDGYTLLLGTTSTHSINPFVFDKLSYSVDQFRAVGLVVTSTFVLMVNPKMPARNLAEFASYIKANPGKVNFGTAGDLTTTDLGRISIEKETGGKVTSIPFKGSTDAVNALLSGDIQASLMNGAQAVQYEKAGKARILAVLGPQRLEIMSHVPTSKEGGYPGIIADSWFGVFAPAKTPQDILVKLNDVIRKSTDGEQIRKYTEQQGGDPNFAPRLGLSEIDAYLAEQSRRWGGLIKSMPISKEKN